MLLYGAGGQVGRRIARELLGRGHEVTGVSRSGTIEGIDHPDVRAVEGDVTDADEVAELAAEHDAVASAIGPAGGDPDVILEGAKALVSGLREAGVDRLVVVGGGGTLKVEDGRDLVDTPDFPEEIRPRSLAHREALELLKDVEDLDWTFVAPPYVLSPGERTGEYRVGERELMWDEDGESRISMEDYAVAFVDELERGEMIRRHMTVAY